MKNLMKTIESILRKADADDLERLWASYVSWAQQFPRSRAAVRGTPLGRTLDNTIRAVLNKRGMDVERDA